MPFDSSNFDPKPPPEARAPLGRGERLLLGAVGLLAFVLFALPVPFASLADIFHWLAGRH